MAQKAILKFLKQDKTTTSVIRISAGELIETHIGVYTNDYQGFDGNQDYLVAPFDCIVRAIRTYDNQVLFENTSPVQTVAHGIQNHVCFMATHMNDSDFNDIGIFVNKTFQQGEIIYREGSKGISSGNHIHMSQALGSFKGGSPTVKLDGVYYNYNGSNYQQYTINADNETHVCDVFFAGCSVDKENGLSDTAKLYTWTDENSNSSIPSSSDTMRLECIKASMANGHYPTRPTFNGTYNSTSYFLTPGDILKLSDIKVSGTNVVCQIKNAYSPTGSNYVEVPSLKNRWFVYDCLYFK